MNDAERIARVYGQLCDTCCITVDFDGISSHEATCELNNLRTKLAGLLSAAKEVAGHSERCPQNIMRAAIAEAVK